MKLFKQWRASGDNRVRTPHGEAHNQIVPVNDPFIVGGEELMYPRDENGSDWNIINCRCTVELGHMKHGKFEGLGIWHSSAKAK